MATSSRKPRTSVIKPGEPGASAKSRLIERLERESEERARQAAEGRKVEKAAKESETATKIQARLSALQTQLKQLTAELEAPDLSAKKKTVYENIKADIEAKIVAVTNELSAERAEPEVEPLKIDEKEHEAILESIERSMLEVITQEASFERLLDDMRGDYTRSQYGDNRDKSSWRLGPFIEEKYLEPGAVEKSVLQDYLANPDSLPKTLKDQAEDALRTMITEKVEASLPAAITDQTLRATLRESLAKQYETDEEKKQMVEEYLSNGVVAGRKPIFDLEGVEATKIALREAVFTRGKMTIDEARAALALFGDNAADRFLENGEVFDIVRGVAKGERIQGALLKRSGKKVDIYELQESIHKKTSEFLVRERKLAEALAELDRRESEFKRLTERDWTKDIAAANATEVERNLSQERSRITAQDAKLVSVNESLVTAQSELEVVRSRIVLLSSQAPEELSYTDLQAVKAKLEEVNLVSGAEDTIRIALRAVDELNREQGHFYAERKLLENVEQWVKEIKHIVPSERQFQQRQFEQAPKEVSRRIESFSREVELFRDSHGIRYEQSGLEDKISNGTYVAQRDFLTRAQPERDRLKAAATQLKADVDGFWGAFHGVNGELRAQISRKSQSVVAEGQTVQKEINKASLALTAAKKELKDIVGSWNPYRKDIKVKAAEDNFAAKELAVQEAEKRGRDLSSLQAQLQNLLQNV